MKHLIINIMFSFWLIVGSLAIAGSPNFEEETKRATSAFRCAQPKITPRNADFGALYGCITGNQETVKLFINEAEDTNGVKNIKLMWNDWTMDVGYGLHADETEAKYFAMTFAQQYAPKLVSSLMTSFFSNSNASFETDDYHIEYRYHRGPKIDERLLVATPKSVQARKNQLSQASTGSIAQCKAAISKAIGYSASSLSSDGRPIKQDGYISFFIDGSNRDQFFCEVHPSGMYKIKAALNSKYPFRYIAEGKF